MPSHANLHFRYLRIVLEQTSWQAAKKGDHLLAQTPLSIASRVTAPSRRLLRVDVCKHRCH